MAFVVDKARPSLVTELCAMNGFTQPTPRTMTRGIRIKASVVDPKIVGETPPTGMAADSEYSFIDHSTLWLASTVKTDRTFS